MSSAPPPPDTTTTAGRRPPTPPLIDAQEHHVGAMEPQREVDAGEDDIRLGVVVLGKDGYGHPQGLDRDALVVILDQAQPHVEDHQVRHLGLEEDVHGEHCHDSHDDAGGQHSVEDHHRPCRPPGACSTLDGDPPLYLWHHRQWRPLNGSLLHVLLDVDVRRSGVSNSIMR